jgi:sterol desaturase/sphingolipid hydroxylase (fatty acid hydroxylase superfamily)
MLAVVPVFLALIAIEAAFGYVTGRARFGARDTASSLAMTVGNILTGLALTGFVGGAYYLASRAAIFHIPFTWWGLALCFLAEDLAYYGFHRTAHGQRWFWASHVVHHSSQFYNLSTALRQTWTGNLSLSFAFWLPLMIIGFPPAMVAMFSGYSLIYQFFIHTEAVGALGPLEWVLNTPSHHRVHHAINPRYLDRNFGGVLIVWDRLFGSFAQEITADPPRYGIVHQLETFNPLKIAFLEWLAILADLRTAGTWRERWLYLFRPPGWSADGSRATSRSIREAWLNEQAPISDNRLALEAAS